MTHSTSKPPSGLVAIFRAKSWFCAHQDEKVEAKPEAKAAGDSNGAHADVEMADAAAAAPSSSEQPQTGQYAGQITGACRPFLS
jgi:hypothetical protein